MDTKPKAYHNLLIRYPYTETYINPLRFIILRKMIIKIDEKVLKELLKFEFRRMELLTNLNEKTFTNDIISTIKNYIKRNKDNGKE